MRERVIYDQLVNFVQLLCQMLLEVISNYAREASNTVKFKMFKIKVGQFLKHLSR